MRRIVYAAVFAALVASMAVPATAQSLELGTVEFFSPAVDRMMKYNILLPRDYESSTARYPVLYLLHYLLHGLGQNYTAWGLSNGASFYAALYDDLVVVMPDAGNSWYVNWVEREAGQKNDWEDHIIQDVVNNVDWHFRTIAQREGRAIAGLSMGASARSRWDSAILRCSSRSAARAVPSSMPGRRRADCAAKPRHAGGRDRN